MVREGIEGEVGMRKIGELGLRAQPVAEPDRIAGEGPLATGGIAEIDFSTRPEPVIERGVMPESIGMRWAASQAE